MRIWGSPLGGFPRNRVLRRALRDYERGAVGYEDLEKVLVSSSLVVIGAQLSSGLAYVVDGMLDWHDIFRPFTSSWRNVTPTGLLRYFDNNFFYRVPLFTGKPEAASYVWAQRVRRYAPLAEPAGFKIVVPGPVTFTYMSKNGSEVTNEELASSIADLLAAEVRLAVEAGASLVQVDEPLLADPDIGYDLSALAAELSSRIASSAGSAKTVLAIYFGAPRADVYENALNARVSCISIDVADAPNSSLKLIESKGFGSHCAVLGLVNSRTVYRDPIDVMVDTATKALKNYEGDEVGVTTTTWLDLVPYEYSISKLRVLSELVDSLSLKLGAEKISEVVKS
ncbi:MAG: hypothetical protein RMH84_02120 [Sulfolobales archaeon]|nr:hypothetical protein [Sulfolobales archaeon]MCX8208633.1 hypothetical protein [Sulfolobales archaeon]MDW8010374.1 hypothetical protein [Sulfolobales archaeon]